MHKEISKVAVQIPGGIISFGIGCRMYSFGEDLCGVVVFLVFCVCPG